MAGMDDDERRPAEVFHPGVFLAEELAALGWWPVDLRLPPGVAEAIIAGKRAVGPPEAKALAKALGTSARFWLNLQAAYDRYRQFIGVPNGDTPEAQT